MITVRSAKTQDVPIIRELVEPEANRRVLIAKDAVSYYEAVQEFRVGVVDREVVGCGALHVMWEDLAEVRTLAVDPNYRGRGVGGLILEHLLDDARALGVRRVFCLTFETDFFARYGFRETTGPSLDPEVLTELLLSPDEGVAEFLDLERVKPNTLGNTRMMLNL